MEKYALLGLFLFQLGQGVVAAEWQQIQERGFLIVGIQGDNPPLSFRDKTGKWIGFEVDLAHALALHLLGSRDKVKFVPLKNQERLPALWHDRVDILIAQMTVTGNRQRLVDFSPSYYTDRVVILYPKARPLPPRPKVGVLHNSSNINVLQGEFPHALPIGLNSYQEGYQALVQGKIDGMILDGLASVTWLQTNPQFKALPTNSFSSLAIALPKGLQYAELRQKITQTIETYKTQPWLDDRVKHWQLNPVK